MVDSSLYPTLLLHLGYVSLQDDDLLLVLCQHWSHLVETNRAVLDEEMEMELATQLLTTVTNETVVEFILRVVTVLTTKSLPDSLAKALILHINKHEPVTQLLYQLASKSSLGKIFYTAACVVWNKSLDDKADQTLYTLGRNIQMGNETMDMEASDTSFLWALSHSKKFAERMVTMQGIINCLTRNKQSKTLAILARHGPTPTNAIRLEDLFLNEDSDAATKEEALSGLHACSKILQPSNDLLDAIMDASIDASDVGVIAANLLCQLFDQGKAKSERLVYLLETNNVQICEMVLASIAKQPACLMQNASLVRSIAKVASRESAQPIILQSVNLFAVVAEDESQWIDMARQPKLVETLVKVAPNPVAMEILWKISTPVSNRRILASHTGLLSSWMRFLRNLAPDEPRRNEWKDRLVDLANLL